ncbi:MAG: hypothetical protein UY70_C0003G0029 [Candidatus Kaiserbacteria bacterium GW2011_GWB1_52_6]|uniref:Endonuclease I n=3 Tax=Candidatus Kaiseribacteriota TaxID=1752734 RepID=A0A0G1XKZ9_9BACT|nr:MAG: hypothetical protein UY67_C0005G0041 [Candidatus Kaiserbacteria bacterium GW2011_GWA2_52_12]KKW28106.1 MAG: hypothetical protein UY70_C0003G0029 [Candidatus Kaiserbacteria bacterium GW2011_GWB1_52_6]KKW31943.1 MAG: hypothetical protein UY74_C0003G0016 [Candidatus Kaiserbacteria bacterium GW2011_GWC2_52_8b]
MGFGTIQEFTARRKAFLEEGVGDWGLYIAICLLALAAFGLGRISALQGSRPPISVTQAAAAAASLGMYPGGQIIASISGGTYYYPWCSGATKIKEGNAAWFKDEQAAQAAGYQPAKNCKGLPVGR